MDNELNHEQHRLNMSPILVGLLGVLAGTIIVAICHCIIMLCGDDRRRQRLDADRTAAAAAAAEAAPRHPTVVESKYCKEHKQDLCSICLGEFKQEESVRILPECAHIFHVFCINKWLEHHPNCPLCRATAVHPPPMAAVLPPEIGRVSEVGGVVE